MSVSFEIYFLGKVDDSGILTGIPKKKLSEQLKHFSGKPVELIIRKKKKYRSIQQNRTWWLYMGMLSDEIGYDKDQMHEICKMKFLKTEAVNEKTGEVYEYLKSTTELTTTEFAELFERLYRWSAETFNMILPKPNEQIEFNID